MGRPFFWPHEHQAENPSVFAAALLRFAPTSWTVARFLDLVDADDDDEPSVYDPSPHPGVALLTMHAAKGKEFASVAGLRVGAHDPEAPDDPEEERRLRYVAMTRAERSLLLACDQPDSPALKEALLNPRWRPFGAEDLRRRLRWAVRRGKSADADRLREELGWRKAFRADP